MPQGKLAVSKLSDVIAETLERWILEGTLKSGDRLPPERDLAVELGVSRPSLREAIQKLSSRGLLQSRQGGGTFVTGRLEAVFSDPWKKMLESHADLRDDALDLIRLLTAQAAEWAALRRTDEDVACLEQGVLALCLSLEGDEGVYDPLAQTRCDRIFRQAVADAAHNAFLGHLMTALFSLQEKEVETNFAQLAQTPRAFSLLGSQYRAIFEAVRDRHAAMARSAALAHSDFFRESLSQSLRLAARRETSLRRLKAGNFSPDAS